MAPGFAQQLLTLWEQGYPQPVVWRGLMLLSLAFPDSDWEVLATIPIGERDYHLLTLYTQLFGGKVQAVAPCPACDEQSEISFGAADISLFDPVQAVQSDVVTVANKQIPFRLPNSLDLLAIANLPEPEQAQHHLLLRCLQPLQKSRQKAWAKRIPKKVQTAVSKKMAALDPQGNIEIVLTCPACAHRWQTVFDIVTFLWHKLDRWAIRLMQDVHTLATMYGWSEEAILNLSPWRRQLYLRMITG